MARWISISSRRWTISIRQWRLAVMARGAGSNRSCARRRFTAQSLSRSTTTSSLTHNKLCRPRSAWHGTAQHISGIYPARGLSPARSSASKRSPTQRRAWINSLPYHHRKRLPSRHRGRHPRLPSCQLGGHHSGHPLVSRGGVNPLDGRSGVYPRVIGGGTRVCPLVSYPLVSRGGVYPLDGRSGVYPQRQYIGRLHA